MPLLLICLFLPFEMCWWCAHAHHYVCMCVRARPAATVFPLECAGGCACTPYIHYCVCTCVRAPPAASAWHHAPNMTPALLTGGGGGQTVDLQRPSGRSSRVCLHTNVPSHRQVNVCQAVTAAPRSHKSVQDRGLGKREKVGLYTGIGGTRQHGGMLCSISSVCIPQCRVAVSRHASQSVVLPSFEYI